MTQFDWSSFLRRGETIAVQGRFSVARFFRAWAVYTSLLLLSILGLAGEQDPKASMVFAVLAALAVACLALGASVATGLVRAYYCVTDQRLMTMHKVLWRQAALKEMPIAGAVITVRDGQVRAREAANGRTIGWSISKPEEERIVDYLRRRGAL